MSHQPCGECQNCILALQNRHMDIVEMDGASSRKIDDIRDLIEQTKYRPATARFKIFIIDEVHMLTKEAFNALLKTLEEPPEYVKFILATTDPLKLPATILSRTQHFRFKSIATNKIINHLAHILNLEGIKYENDALEIIIYSKNHVDVNTVTDMLGLVDPKFITELFEAVFAKDYAKLVTQIKILEDYEADMVVDELIAYLKDRMYANDALYSTLVLDRFFRILSDSKYLFSINADGSFVLSLIFFKMIEALRIKEVDQMIESLQKEIHRPAITSVDIQPNQVQIEQSETLEENIEKPLQEPAITSEPVQTLNNEINPHQKTFDKLVLNIKDRNIELGKCFENSISFISYENNTLTWESCANAECKKVLTHGYSAIKQLVREVFSFETKIEYEVCTKSIKETPTIEQPTMQHEQSISMVEDAEIGGSGSCITNCQNDDSSKEINGADIKNEPMVQKAVELFEAKKMTILQISNSLASGINLMTSSLAALISKLSILFFNSSKTNFLSIFLVILISFCSCHLQLCSSLAVR